MGKSLGSLYRLCILADYSLTPFIVSYEAVRLWLTYAVDAIFMSWAAEPRLGKWDVYGLPPVKYLKNSPTYAFLIGGETD